MKAYLVENSVTFEVFASQEIEFLASHMAAWQCARAGLLTVHAGDKLRSETESGNALLSSLESLVAES